MLQLVTTGQFLKDYKRLKRRGYNIEMLENVIDTLLKEMPLDRRHQRKTYSDRFAYRYSCRFV